MKLQNCLLIFMLFCAIQISCSKNSVEQPGNETKPLNKSAQASTVQMDNDYAGDLKMLRNVLEPEDVLTDINKEGQEVDLKMAHQCIGLFNPSMREHGIVADTAPLHPDVLKIKCFSNYKMITEFEEFGGENLLTWMMNVGRRSNSAYQGHKWAIRLYFGMYDQAFLDRYVHDKNQRSKLLGRTTVFLVPYFYDDKTTPTPAWDDPEMTAYELGGLEP